MPGINGDWYEALKGEFLLFSLLFEILFKVRKEDSLLHLKQKFSIFLERAIISLLIKVVFSKLCK